ncbi:MAG: single-stranded DNA-binding protein [Bacteroidales bacterium]|nr:single-stranded DNA-binding protein [Bacteroidales bacterium]
MEQINQVLIRGRVGIVRMNTVNERSVCNFSVATNLVRRTADNTTVEEVTWHNCTAWGNKRFPDLSLIKVGTPIEVKGRLRNNKYSGADGAEHYSTEISVGEFTIIPENEVLTSENAL